MHNTNYIIRFVLVMTSIVALVLAGLSTVLKDVHKKNEALFNKRAILSAANKVITEDMGKPVSALSDAEIMSVFEGNIEQTVINMKGEVQEGMLAENVDLAVERKKPEADRLLPIFKYNAKSGSPYYIVSVRGNGLWDEIWGNVALESDLKTLAGASFDHKSETPGLGAEIKDNPSFPQAFVGKQIYNEGGDYVSVAVRKGGAKNPAYEVDGISGATVTSDGVTEMMHRGLAYYLPYFQTLKN